MSAWLARPCGTSWPRCTAARTAPGPAGERRRRAPRSAVTRLASSAPERRLIIFHERPPGLHVGDAALVADDDDFLAASDLRAVQAARPVAVPHAGLAVLDLAGAAGGDGHGNSGDRALEPIVLRVHRLLAFRKDPAKEQEDEPPACQ